jgi:hypothetical protein
LEAAAFIYEKLPKSAHHLYVISKKNANVRYIGASIKNKAILKTSFIRSIILSLDCFIFNVEKSAQGKFALGTF